MAAAHGWDFAGAQAAGLRTAWIAPPHVRGCNGKPKCSAQPGGVTACDHESAID